MQHHHISKLILAASVLVLFASFITIAWSERLAHDPDYEKDWWALYFQDPSDTGSPDFTIENHSNGTGFSWEIFADKSKVDGGVVEIPKGRSADIDVVIPIGEDKKMTIRVTDRENLTKEIYRVAN